jgi:TPR repeat protein
MCFFFLSATSCVTQVGRGVPQDAARAAELWKVAAAAGVPECLLVLGNRLCRPHGGGGDGSSPGAAAAPAVAAAGSSNGAAAAALPEGLSKAQRKRAKEKAKKNLAAAAANGGGVGSGSSSSGGGGRPEGRADRQARTAREAAALFACAAASGLAAAQFNVANCLEHGVGGVRRRAAAEAW